MKILKLFCLFGILSCFFACSDDSTEVDTFESETSLETRKTCEGCAVTLSMRGCFIDFEVSEGCAEVETVTWIFPVNPDPSITQPDFVYNRSLNVTGYPGEYCIKVLLTDGCVLEECITVTEACEDCHCEVDIRVNENQCKLIATASDDCEKPLSYEWYVDGNTTTGRTATYEFGGFYSVTVIDANGCMARKVTDFVDPCDNCNCNVEIEVDDINCELNAVTSNGCESPNFEWYVDGETLFGQTVPYTLGGTYKLTVTDDNGCFIELFEVGVERCE